MTIDQIKERLRDIPTVEIALATGLNYNTVKNFKLGRGLYSKTVTALTRYIERIDNPAAE
jgi:hypothetical protein